MKLILRLLIFFSVVGLLIYYAGLKHSAPISAPSDPSPLSAARIWRRSSVTATANSGLIGLAQSAARPLTRPGTGSAHRSATSAVQPGSWSK